jgi:hypothetical protein
MSVPVPVGTTSVMQFVQKRLVGVAFKESGFRLSPRIKNGIKKVLRKKSEKVFIKACFLHCSAVYKNQIIFSSSAGMSGNVWERLGMAGNVWECLGMAGAALRKLSHAIVLHESLCALGVPLFEIVIDFQSIHMLAMLEIEAP